MSSYEIIRRPLSLMVDVLNDEACRDALLAIERIEKRNDQLAAALNGFIWLDNNRDNYGGAAWLGYFDAALKDARAALAEDTR